MGFWTGFVCGIVFVGAVAFIGLIGVAIGKELAEGGDE